MERVGLQPPVGSSICMAMPLLITQTALAHIISHIQGWSRSSCFSTSITFLTIMFNTWFRLEIDKLIQKLDLATRSSLGQVRRARMMTLSEGTMSKVLDTRLKLLRSYESANHLMSFKEAVHRHRRAGDYFRQKER